MAPVQARSRRAISLRLTRRACGVAIVHGLLIGMFVSIPAQAPRRRKALRTKGGAGESWAAFSAIWSGSGRTAAAGAAATRGPRSRRDHSVRRDGPLRL